MNLDTSATKGQYRVVCEMMLESNNHIDAVSHFISIIEEPGLATDFVVYGPSSQGGVRTTWYADSAREILAHEIKKDKLS